MVWPARRTSPAAPASSLYLQGDGGMWDGTLPSIDAHRCEAAWGDGLAAPAQRRAASPLTIDPAPLEDSPAAWRTPRVGPGGVVRVCAQIT